MQVNRKKKFYKQTRKQRILHMVMNWVMNIVLVVAGMVTLWLLLIVFCFSSFKIPTDSMQPTLQPGDNILVQKMSMGPRLFNIWAALDKEEVKIHRLPGIGSVKRNDVLVFNFPLSKDWSKIELDVMLYYAKRCIALPGDTLEVHNSVYRVRGVKEPLGDINQQYAMRRLNLDTLDDGVANWNPRISGWTMHEAGPLIIPRKGNIIWMNRLTGEMYGRLIEWEQGKKMKIEGDTVLLAGHVLPEYRFMKNYYFMAGDYCEDSMDSRYWGLVPEEYIVGKAFIVWRSVDPHSGKFRWDRFLKWIN